MWKTNSHGIQTLDHGLEAPGRERKQYGGMPFSNGKKGLRMLSPLASRPGFVTGFKRQTSVTVKRCEGS